MILAGFGCIVMMLVEICEAIEKLAIGSNAPVASSPATQLPTVSIQGPSPPKQSSGAAKLMPQACPKCGGNLVPAVPGTGAHLMCKQCGWMA